MQKWMSKVALHHDEFVLTVKNFGEHFLAEDIVQEMYIKISKYCSEDKIMKKNGQVNMGYIYFVLRNLFLEFQNEKNKHRKVNIEDVKNLGVSDHSITENSSFSKLLERVEEESNNWHWYDRDLFKHYFEKGKSMRQLSKETRISTSSIFQTIKYCKAQISENLKDDYENFKNNDIEIR
jgi:RNA polymerase sigma factor (sigma-70 family)